MKFRLLPIIKQIGEVEAIPNREDFEQLHEAIYESPLFCPDANATQKMIHLIEKVKDDGDSLGGVVEFYAFGVPVGLGDPVYEKLEANLAQALMTLPATKGFEIGSGFSSVRMLASEHNDLFSNEKDKIETKTNYAGGTLGGISSGMPIVGRVAFKPTSSIKKPQATLTRSGERSSFKLPEGSRHDPCVAIRAVPVVEAMVALVLVDAILMNRSVRI